MHLSTTIICLTLSAFVGLGACLSRAAEKTYTLEPDEHGMVLKSPDGRTVLRYMTKKPAKTNLTANSVCCLYPVYTPQGVRAVDFAPGDHRHHRGIFLAWHTSNCGDHRADFWGWGEMSPTETRVIRNRDVKLVAATSRGAELEVRNDWCIAEATVLQEESQIKASERDGVLVIDWTFHFVPRVDVTLNQTAFGGFCIKGRKGDNPVYHSPSGRVDLPNPHHLKPETDWPAAAWYDYTVQTDDGKTVGIAVVDHPRNPTTTWHNLEPIAMVNPCIVAGGPVTIKKSQLLELRYRVVVHDGPPPQKVLNKLADEFRR